MPDRVLLTFEPQQLGLVLRELPYSEVGEVLLQGCLDGEWSDEPGNESRAADLVFREMLKKGQRGVGQ